MEQGTTDPTPAPAPGPGIPPGLERVRAFVNTREYSDDTIVEELATPADLEAFLATQGLADAGETFDEDDVAKAIAVREAVRALLEGNAGHAVDPDAIGALDEAAGRAHVRVSFRASEEPALVPARAGLDGALGTLFAAIATAVADGSWIRLKACRNDGCRWAYFDASRNRSARWCSMSGCGNRMKGRAYRRRARSTGRA